MKKDVTVSPAYLKKNKNQILRPILIPVRVYHNNTIDTFNYYLNDVGGKSIRLLDSQLKSGIVVEHTKSIRYTSLINFGSRKIRQFVRESLNKNLTIDRADIKKKVADSINNDFEIEFTETLDNQKIKVKTRDSGELLIDKVVYDSFSSTIIPSEPEVLPDGNVELNDWDEDDYEKFLIHEQHIHEQEKQKLIELRYSTAVRFKKGYYNQNNIFELFASIKYNDDLDPTYNKIIIRLFEYRYFRNPNEEISQLSTQWVHDFFFFLWNEGYYRLNTKIFDPLKFDGSIFNNKIKMKYKPQSYHKLMEVFNTVSKKILPSEIYKNIDFSKIDLKEICGEEKSKKGSHINENLNMEEFDKLFFYKFDLKEQVYYQEVFSSIYSKTKIKIEVPDLETARDLFCLQTMAGGIRSYNDLVTVEFDKSGHQLSFFADKVDTRMQNPLNVYTEIIANDYNYQLPHLRFQRSHNSLTDIYRALLKTIAEIIPLSRKIICNNELIMLKNLFVPKFGRKTFSQILYDEYNVHPDDISIFTGHKTGKGNVLVFNYLDMQSPKKKKSIFNKIKLPKGRNKNTPRRNK